MDYYIPNQKPQKAILHRSRASRPPMNLDDPAMQVDLSDPVIQFITGVVKEVEEEQGLGSQLMFDSWLKPMEHKVKRRGPNKGKITATHKLYNWHYKTLVEVAARVYERALTAQELPPTRKPASPAAQIARTTSPMDRRFVRRELAWDYSMN